MKISVLLTIFSSCMLFAESKISDFRWKNRLLILSQGDDSWVEKLDAQRARLEERDLKVFILSGAGKTKFPAAPELAKALAERFAPDPEIPKIHLIGKDGRTVLDWRMEEFSFEKLYASIDRMPMRQREMREKR